MSSCEKKFEIVTLKFTTKMFVYENYYIFKPQQVKRKFTTFSIKTRQNYISTQKCPNSLYNSPQKTSVFNSTIDSLSWKKTK